MKRLNSNQPTIAGKLRTFITSTPLCALLLAGCSGDTESPGSLTVLLQAEEVIIEGLQPGDDTENIRDGWEVEFDNYMLAIGHIHLEFATDHDVEAEADEVFVVDLTEIPADGLPLWSIDGLRPGRWGFAYSTTGAAHGAEPHDSVSDDDFEEMESNDWTYLVNGTLSKSDGQSCPPSALAMPPADATSVGENDEGDDCYEASSVRFSFGAMAETEFSRCTLDELPGFAIPEGGSQTVAATIHGDHLFFNGFPEGDESGVSRLAQWLADCDLDLDGTVTQQELEAIAPADLAEFDDRFQTGGSPIESLDNMYTYVMAQLKTQGHFQGEGECAIDGEEHNHGDED